MRVGLFFGSFNPIHFGHIALANAFKSQAHLEELWWVLSPQNPHKSPHELAPFQDRLTMLSLALNQESDVICTIENQLPTPSYTVDTLRALESQYPLHEWTILLGGDSWNNLPSWKEGDYIENHYSIFVYPRTPQSALRKGRFQQLAGEFIAISSTQIRQDIGKINSLLLTDPQVIQYILENKLY